MNLCHPDVERYSLTSGGSSILSSGSRGSATIMVYLRADRQVKTKELIQRWQNQTKDWAGYDINISSSSQTMMMMGGSDVEIILRGTDRGALEEASVMVEEIMYQNPDITHITSTATAREPRAEVKINPTKASAVGLTPIQVISSMYTAIGGNNAASITQGGREYDVRVEYPRDKYRKITDIAGMTLTAPTGSQIPLMDIATIEYTTSPQSIYRQDNQYQITISGQPSLATQLTMAAEIKAEIAQMELPQGVSLANSSQEERMASEFTAILSAVLLMFMVMAMQFESARFSLVVMICIPFSIVGALILMWMTGISISMTSLMGFLLLFSTVINNGILYIDTATELQAEGVDPETALIDAGIGRMRPILMTTCVSLIAMIPEGLGIGNGAEIMQGMAIVIIGGLIASTLLTLLLWPTFYLLFGGGSQKRQEKIEKMRDDEEEPEAATELAVQS